MFLFVDPRYVPLKAMKQVCGFTAAAGPKVAAECGMHLEAVGVGLERRRVEAVPL